MIKFVGLAQVTLVLLVSRITFAQTSVVIVVPHPSTPDYYAFEHRLRSELVAEGFQPVSVEVPTDSNRQGMQDSARRLMSHAAISISIHDGMVSGTVWIQGRASNRTSEGDAWRTVPDYPVNEQAPSIFAVKATDVLHGGLLELGYIGDLPESPRKTASDAPSVPSGETPTSARTGSAVPTPTTPAKRRPASPAIEGTVARPTRAKAEKAPRNWRLSASGKSAVYLVDYPVGIGFSLGVARRLHAAWTVGVAATYFAQNRFNGNPGEGEAMVSRGQLGARLEYLQPLSKRLSVFEQVESGLHVTFVSSNASRPYVSYSPHSSTGYSQLGFGSIWALSGSAALIGSFSLLVPWRRADIVVVDHVVAKAASPAFVIDVGAQVSF